MRARTFLVLFSLLGAAGAGIETACSSDAATPSIEPITGIQIRAERLLAGKGCGRSPSQALKYAALVKDNQGHVRAGGLYDCFADALFQNLVATGPDGGSARFTIDVFVFNAAAYEAPGHAETIRNVVATGLGGGAIDTSTMPTTWVTQCRAIEQVNIESVAECDPLVTSDPTSVVRIATESFSAMGLDGGVASGSPDGGTGATGTDGGLDDGPALDGGSSAVLDAGGASAVVCGTDYTQVLAAVGRSLGPDGTPVVDAGSDAALDAGADADAGPADAGGVDAASDAAVSADAGADAGDGGASGKEPDVKTANCPEPLDFTVPTGRDTVVEVALLKGATVVGRTTCTAFAVPRLLVTATCKPITR